MGKTIASFASSAGLNFQNSLRIPSLVGLQPHYEIIPGKPGRPAKYAPDKPAEKFLAHLRRLGWIERDVRARYGVTPLGHALLRAEASADSDAEDASVMVLTADDELAYGRVLGVIAQCDEALIVDGYLATQELAHILKDSSAARFLVSNKLPKGRLAELAVQIRTTPRNEDGAIRELRRANFHDRYIISDHNVYGLGSSLNGVGKQSMTTLIAMPGVAAQAVRAEVESLWDDAEIVAQTAHDEVDKDVADIEGRESGARAIRREEGGFQHKGCNVRHRSQQAAERCTSGP